jgi:hypothetical protein
MDRQLQLSAMEALKFYGSVASTNGIDEAIKLEANKRIDRIMCALEPALDELMAEMSGLQL